MKRKILSERKIEDIKKEMLELEQKIKYHNNLYHNLSTSEISDQEFDALEVKYHDVKFEYHEMLSYTLLLMIEYRLKEEREKFDIKTSFHLDGNDFDNPILDMLEDFFYKMLTLYDKPNIAKNVVKPQQKQLSIF